MPRACADACVRRGAEPKGRAAERSLLSGRESSGLTGSPSRPLVFAFQAPFAPFHFAYTARDDVARVCLWSGSFFPGSGGTPA
jgi:hypothetical protein